MALSEVLDDIKTKQNFYRNFYRKIVAWLLWIMVLLYILCAGIMFETFTRSLPLFYSTSNDGTVMGLRATSPPEKLSTEPIEQY